jgi:Zn-finger nucleic acid-binding protein
VASIASVRATTHFVDLAPHTAGTKPPGVLTAGGCRAKLSAKMQCPACFNPLSEMQVGSLTVDVCEGGCGGIWFDAFELQRADDPKETAGEAMLHISRDPTIQVDLTRKRACPRCEGIKLKKHFFSAKRRVEVDECPNCGGYWLDAGELAQIRRERAEESPKQARPDAGFSAAEIRYLYRLRA